MLPVSAVHRVSVELMSFRYSSLNSIWRQTRHNCLYSLITCMKVEVLKYWRFVPWLSVPLLSHNLKSEGKPVGFRM